MRRPGMSLVIAGGLLVALAIPALSLKSVTSDIDELPQDLPVIMTYNADQGSVPAEGVTTTVVVKADDVRSGQVAAGIESLVAEVNSSVRSGQDPRSPTARTAPSRRSTSPTPGCGTDDASVTAMNEMRDDIIPATVGGVAGTRST